MDARKWLDEMIIRQIEGMDGFALVSAVNLASPRPNYSVVWYRESDGKMIVSKIPASEIHK